MKMITAKFNSTCTQLLCKIYKGEPMLYDYNSKKCYSCKSQVYKDFEAKQEQLGDAAHEAAYADSVWDSIR